MTENPLSLEKIEIKIIDGKECEIPKKGYLRLLNEKDVESIVDLHERVLRTMESPYFFSRRKKEDIQFYVKNGRYIGAFLCENEHLIAAYCMSTTLPQGNENYWEIINYPNPDECVNDLISMVDPKYRKNKLFPIMIKNQYTHFQEVEKKTQFFFTIYPYNPRNMPWAIQNGGIVIGYKENSSGDGHHRFFFQYDPKRKRNSDRKFVDTTKIEFSDFESQNKLYKEGFVGYKLVSDEEKRYILLGKEVRKDD